VKVLVIGGTQFNGLALVQVLARAGHDVTVLNRGVSQVELPDGVHRLTADRTDPDSVRAALAGTQWDCVQDMTAYHPPEVELMIELLDGNVGHYIFASSTVIYAATGVLPVAEDGEEARAREQGQIEYGLHKLLCEDLLVAAHHERGFPATTVPFAMVFGPNNTLRDREQKMFHRLLLGRPVLVPGDGETLLQIGHVDDQARALEQMMGRSVTFGRRYNLTGAQAVTRNAYVAEMERVVGRDANVVRIPPAAMDRLYGDVDLNLDLGVTNVGMDIRSSAANAPAEESPLVRLFRRKFQLSGLVQQLAPSIWWWNQSTVFSIDRLKADIGWAPQHTFASAVEHTYDWFTRTGLHTTGASVDWTFEDQVLAFLNS
jgi:nucleoside-diphosphate-sugar epimerase